jgi:ABC-type dipeptide/oligopeptide/nickel transport system permease subunit
MAGLQKSIAATASGVLWALLIGVALGYVAEYLAGSVKTRRA